MTVVAEYIRDEIPSDSMSARRREASRDFLDEVISERSRTNAGFRRLVDSALDRRQLLRALAARREQLGLTQTAVARKMGTSQSAIARIEAGELDAKLSTVERYASAIGQRLEWNVVPNSKRGNAKTMPSDTVDFPREKLLQLRDSLDRMGEHHEAIARGLEDLQQRLRRARR